MEIFFMIVVVACILLFITTIISHDFENSERILYFFMLVISILLLNFSHKLAMNFSKKETSIIKDVISYNNITFSKPKDIKITKINGPVWSVYSNKIIEIIDK